jgi:hypothetical protein
MNESSNWSIKYVLDMYSLHKLLIVSSALRMREGGAKPSRNCAILFFHLESYLAFMISLHSPILPIKFKPKLWLKLGMKHIGGTTNVLAWKPHVKYGLPKLML